MHAASLNTSHVAPPYVEPWALCSPTLSSISSPDISAAALCARLGHWGMKGSLFLTAPILPMFAASFLHCTKMLMAPCNVLCGTKTRRLSATVWQPFSTWLMTPTKTRPHKPMLAEWTSEIVSLSLSQLPGMYSISWEEKPFSLPSWLASPVWLVGYSPEWVQLWLGCTSLQMLC